MDKEAFLKELANELQVDPNVMHSEFELIKDIWDSLAIVGTIVLIDELFELTVPTDKLVKCKLAGDIWELVQETQVSSRE